MQRPRHVNSIVYNNIMALMTLQMTPARINHKRPKKKWTARWIEKEQQLLSTAKSLWHNWNKANSIVEYPTELRK